ncbi:replication initiation protein, partial [Salmonella enterica subsp. enterica serovar Montevideo]|nr:replication initiation protein [Salmonella enterica subsp. enterica serovar Montevideo]
VHYRNPKLISSKVVVPREPEEEVPEQNYDEVIKALKAAGIDPQKLAKVLASVKPGND